MDQFLLVAGIHWLSVMSPGPDFAMVMRNSLVYSRKTGVLAAAGLACGIALHVSYSLLGIGLLISRSILLFDIIRWIGALYLIYIGIKSLRSQPEIAELGTAHSRKDLTAVQAIRMGFLTNILNPKVTLFFLALFTTVINPHTATLTKALYGVEMVLATFVWFAFVAVVLSHNKVNNIVARSKHKLERTFGVVLVALGLKVALGGHK